MRTLLLIGLLLVPGSVQAEEWPTHLALGSYMTLQGADLALTAFALGSRQGREINPLLAPFSNRPAVLGATKMAIASGSSYLMLRLHRTHPRLAFWMAVAGSGFYAGVVAHNARLVRALNEGNR